MKVYVFCITLYLISLMSESSTPNWLKVLTSISLAILCVETIIDMYRSEKRMKELEKKIDKLQKDKDCQGGSERD